MAKFRHTFEDSEAPEVLRHLQKDIITAASNGDVETVERLLKNGANVNDKDIYGRTALHYAVNNEHLITVKILLKHGADVTQITNKGSTALHTVSYKGYRDILELLVEHVSPHKIKYFVNMKTIFDGNTALHISAKGGYMAFVKILLSHGAAYDAVNKEGKLPIDLSKDEKIINFLNLIERLFRDVRVGNVEALSNLRGIPPKKILTLTSVVNCEGNTLIQVAEATKHADIADKLLKIMGTHQRDLLRDVRNVAEACLKSSESSLTMLRKLSFPYPSDNNTEPRKTVHLGSLYLLSAAGLVLAYRQYSPAPINDKNIKSINDILLRLEFEPEHISLQCPDDYQRGDDFPIVCKGKGKNYYMLLHNPQKKGIRAFLELVDKYIQDPIKRFIMSLEDI